MRDAEQLLLPFDQERETPPLRTLDEILDDSLNGFAWYAAEGQFDHAEACALLAFGAWCSMLVQSERREA